MCSGIAAAAKLLELAETALFGRAWLESLVLAILIGAVIRTFWVPDKRWLPGIHFSAKALLEVAVFLLGLSMNLSTLAATGAGLFLGITVVVGFAIPASYLLGRVFGLPRRIALLVACGNSICGNSAIAAIAPVIGADGDDIASSIAFTAILGVLVVLGLPLLIPLLHLSQNQYGIMAGLTVYAVPQVLAATMPVGAVATHIGTLVKLVRVLLLAPVIVALPFFTRRWRAENAPSNTALPLHRLVPWFIVGFLALAILRSLAIVPDVLLAPAEAATRILTVLSMAALGLGVDVKVVARSGKRVLAAATASLVLLGLMSFELLRLLQVH